MVTYMKKHKRALDKYKKPFFEKFQTNLVDYFDIFTGFHTCEFDKQVIKTPNNVSMKDHVTAVYGQDACEMIESLIFSGDKS